MWYLVLIGVGDNEADEVTGEGSEKAIFKLLTVGFFDSVLSVLFICIFEVLKYPFKNLRFFFKSLEKKVREPKLMFNF